MLVKQLREYDTRVNRPILLHAAASRNLQCFKRVWEELESTAGWGEPREQLQVKDHKGRTIILRAAASKRRPVFRYVLKRFLASNASSNELDWLEVRDNKQMGVFHHACRRGCSEVLEYIVERALDKQTRGGRSLGTYLLEEDGHGVTPLMHVLRHDCRKQPCEEFDNKLKLLSKEMSDEEWRSAFLNANREGATALMHAAHGGPVPFERARSEIVSQLEQNGPNSGLNLNDGLRSAADDHDGAGVSRCGMLLAEAASGGHIEVLRCVLDGIKVTSVVFLGAHTRMA